VAIRALVHEVAPEATEKISYGMPTFVLAGNLVLFAVFKDHTGFYPTPSGTAAFQAEIASYKSGKGSIQFPHGEELPMDLIRRIVEFRVAENRAKAPGAGAKSTPRKINILDKN
jgi:uncharacterized protein YdhG (YjbR/CyaY superfamily)